MSGCRLGLLFLKTVLQFLLCEMNQSEAAVHRKSSLLPAETDGLSFYICPGRWMIQAPGERSEPPVRAPENDHDAAGAGK